MKDTSPLAGSGRIDIDYQVLHDAFFKFRGETEDDEDARFVFAEPPRARPWPSPRRRNLSDELKAAIGIDGVNGPPPWLINMPTVPTTAAYPKLERILRIGSSGRRAVRVPCRGWPRAGS